jgi:hypothetical protein
MRRTGVLHLLPIVCNLGDHQLADHQLADTIMRGSSAWTTLRRRDHPWFFWGVPCSQDPAIMTNLKTAEVLTAVLLVLKRHMALPQIAAKV